MEKISFVLNGADTAVEVDPTTPLLWVLRDHLGLTGTKYGCGMAVCGCCTVHLNGDAVRSCVTPVARASGQKVTTVEGLSPDLGHAVQRAWLAEQVPQCGYCQSGQLMSAAVPAGDEARSPTDADIDDAMSGNLCRCGTYPRIRRAIHRAAEIAAAEPRSERRRAARPARLPAGVRRSPGGGLLLTGLLRAEACRSRPVRQQPPCATSPSTPGCGSPRTTRSRCLLPVRDGSGHHDHAARGARRGAGRRLEARQGRVLAGRDRVSQPPDSTGCSPATARAPRPSSTCCFRWARRRGRC